jgi:N6-L-threonylcarbamoyladenine synthase
MGLDIPLLDINHMKAHILAHFIDEEGYDKPSFPFIGVTISGGHTQIVRVDDYFKMEVIGETIDDAVGEAFDKSAKIMDLPYPGGPLIDKYAQLGNPKAFPFTKPKVGGLNFSFSGLKTQIMYFVQRQQEANPDFLKGNRNDVCASIQYTIVNILMDKIKKAVKETGITQIAIGGGVSANSGIRTALKNAETTHGWKTFLPKFQYTTDNAAMIGIVGYLKYKDLVEKDSFQNLEVSAQSRLKI